MRGRFVEILYRDGSHRYIINVSSWHLTVANVEQLIQALDSARGSCHVEHAYLILYIPDGYALEVKGSAYSPELQLRELNMQATELV